MEHIAGFSPDVVGTFGRGYYPCHRLHRSIWVRGKPVISYFDSSQPGAQNISHILHTGQFGDCRFCSFTFSTIFLVPFLHGQHWRFSLFVILIWCFRFSRNKHLSSCFILHITLYHFNQTLMCRQIRNNEVDCLGVCVCVVVCPWCKCSWYSSYRPSSVDLTVQQSHSVPVCCEYFV